MQQHLNDLEAESIHIFREVVAKAENPVLLYSIGKDSSVLLHLAMKAYYPQPIPFPVMHVDTTWKFKEMIRFRDEVARKMQLQLLVKTNPRGKEENITPFTHDPTTYTNVMKTDTLKAALDEHQFDMAIGGARRDEEKSRAKERIFSFRDDKHRWDPKNQRPELWDQFNTEKNRNESIRVFPLSNWTELDIWQYIAQENIDIVPLYYAAMRPVVKRNGAWIMKDDERLVLKPHEEVSLKLVRFRTLGCYPLTGAIESSAVTLRDIIQEIRESRYSERQGRMIDNDSQSAMEKKKAEGYF